MSIRSILKRTSIFTIISFTVLNSTASCSFLPAFLQPKTVPNLVYGILKKDPTNSQIKASGFVKANAVKRDGEVDSQGLSKFTVKKVIEVSKDIIFILTNEKGLFRSSDAGFTWERRYVFPVESSEQDAKKDTEIATKIAQNDAFKIKNFVVDKSNSKNIFIVGLGVDSLGKVYQTSDGGDTFKIKYSEVDAGINVIDVTIDPKNPLRVYILLTKGALIRSFDGGNNWEKAYTFVTAPVVLDFIPEFGNTFYAVDAVTGQFYTSSDDGNTWNAKQLKLEQPDKVDEKGVKIPTPPKAITSITNIIPVAIKNSNKRQWLMIANDELIVTQDINENFKKITLPIQNEQTKIGDIAYDTKTGIDHLYVALKDKLLESRNNGQGWSWNTNDLIQLSDPIGEIQKIVISRDNPDIIYLGLTAPAKKKTGYFAQ